MKYILIVLIIFLSFKLDAQNKPSVLVEKLSNAISKHYEKQPRKIFGQIETIKPVKAEPTLKIKPIYLKRRLDYRIFLLEYYFFKEEDYRKGTGVYLKVTSFVKSREIVKINWVFTNPIVETRYINTFDTIRYGESKEYVFNNLWYLELDNCRIPFFKVEYRGKKYKTFFNRKRRYKTKFLRYLHQNVVI